MQDITLPEGLRLNEESPTNDQSGAGFATIDVSTRLCTGRIHLHGAQVTAWQPRGASEPVFWQSTQAQLASDKAIRGGVPISFPWFADGRSHNQKPAHGLARLADWKLVDASSTPGGEVTVRLRLDDETLAKSKFAPDAEVTLVVTMGVAVQMSLVVRAGSAACHFEDAMHNYFHVGDVTRASVKGLDAARYLDKVSGRDGQLQEGPVTFSGETDRVYQSVASASIVDPVLNRTIRIEKSGSESTVVWNPWSKRSEKDFGMAPGEWQQMVCVETANALADEVYLEAGEKHVLSQVISLG